MENVLLSIILLFCYLIIIIFTEIKSCAIYSKTQYHPRFMQYNLISIISINDAIFMNSVKLRHIYASPNTHHAGLA